ncbi:UDP-N-acetylglucosamine--N-acetylmuramyl-(pentapeptide) pyrophosphoryl-undecaprenol N-acetylglucosamine transferase, partial [Tetrabaena socialis]
VQPALAIAADLADHGVQAVFLGETYGLEARTVRQHGFTVCAAPAAPELSRPFRSAANALSMLRLPLCVLRSAWALMHAAPDVVLGMGGRSSAPTCVAAVLLGIPLVLYEMNALAGPANRALHLLARRTLLAYEQAREGFRLPDRCQVVGAAVRPDVLAKRSRRKARKALRLPAQARVLLVLGGADGCGYLNACVHNALPQLVSVPGLQVLWQTGHRQFPGYAAGYAAECPNIRVVPYVDDIGNALAAADLVLSRAGPATVAELRATGVPSVLVPSPATHEEQQTANAGVLGALAPLIGQDADFKRTRPSGIAEVAPQVDVDEIGIAGRLLPLLAPDSKRLAAMRAAVAACAPECTAPAARVREAVLKEIKP